MKVLLWLKYFIYFVIILGLTIIEGEFLLKIPKSISGTYTLLGNVIMLLSNIFIGIILGAEQFIKEIKKNGSWSINLPRFVLMGIPFFYCSLGYIYSNIQIPFIQNIIAYPALHLLYGKTNFIILYQFLFGYVMITSFRKVMK